jgi:uridine kinase
MYAIYDKNYDIQEINRRIRTDPVEFVASCDERMQQRIDRLAQRIADGLAETHCPIILVAGPSASGKTTTAQKLDASLEALGLATQVLSLDNYYQTLDPDTCPRTPEGKIDLESPLCLDLPLLAEHLAALSRGDEVLIPYFDFPTQRRDMSRAVPLRLGPNELAIFEGIHALNDMITERHPEAFKLYISAQSDVVFGGRTVFKRTWFRLVRRTVRDYNFRGSSPAETMSMWANVRRGEKLHISRFKEKADFQFDTTLAYELPVFDTTATQLFQSVPEGIERFDELRSVLPALQLFGDIAEEDVAPDSLVREFIGGGMYE